MQQPTLTRVQPTLTPVQPIAKKTGNAENRKNLKNVYPYTLDY